MSVIIRFKLSVNSFHHKWWSVFLFVRQWCVWFRCEDVIPSKTWLCMLLMYIGFFCIWPLVQTVRKLEDFRRGMKSYHNYPNKRTAYNSKITNIDILKLNILYYYDVIIIVTKYLKINLPSQVYITVIFQLKVLHIL